MEKQNQIKDILNGENLPMKKALFSFDAYNDDEELILNKFYLFSRYFFPKYFMVDDAPFHKDIDRNNLKAYLGEISSYTNIAFRGGAKTVRTKLFMAFCIANDMFHKHRYIRVLALDRVNSQQIVTDLYNMLACTPELVQVYPEIFAKTDKKREEKMSVFTTATGVKVSSDTVIVDQRGAVQEEARPSFLWFEDFETRKSLRSLVQTQAIWDALEEARTGLAVGGASVYTCNYISERGNVHRLVQRENQNHVVHIVPIRTKDGQSAWPARYSLADIKQMEEEDDDFAGERMCEPSSGADILFSREVIDEQKPKEVLRKFAGINIYYDFDPSGRYAVGADVAGGVGLDSSTMVAIDFATYPARVVATYYNNEIKPDTFGYEMVRCGEYYGECLLAPEKNNHGHATIAIVKLNYPKKKIFTTKPKSTRILSPSDVEPTEYGWDTNVATKPKMMFDLVKAVESGHLVLTCPKLIAEARSYTRDDLMDKDADPRLVTRHFDLLTACAIAFQMKDYVGQSAKQQERILSMQEAQEMLDFDPFSVI